MEQLFQLALSYKQEHLRCEWVSGWYRQERLLSGGDWRTTATLGCDHSCQLPPLMHTLFQDCIAYALSNQPNVISRKMGKDDWRTGNSWLLSLSAAGAVHSIRSRAEESGAGVALHTYAAAGQRRDPVTHCPAPPACPCQPVLHKEPQHSPLSPAQPSHSDIPRVDSLPVVTRRKAMTLARCWAGEAP